MLHQLPLRRSAYHPKQTTFYRVAPRLHPLNSDASEPTTPLIIAGNFWRIFWFHYLRIRFLLSQIAP